MITPKLPLRNGLPFIVTGLALRRRRRPRPTPTTSRRPRSSSTRRARRPRRSPTGRTCSCRPTTTRATRRASTSASTCPRARPPSPTASSSRSGPTAGRSHFVYVQRQPMATELLQLAVGQYDVTNVGFHSGVFLRDVTVEEHHARDPARCSTSRPAQIDYMQAARRQVPVRPLRLARGRGRPRLRAGDADARADGHLAGSDDFTQDTWDPTLLHELSHMWFGDSVAPYDVERPVAQRGPRQLVRVPLRRGARASSRATPSSIPDPTRLRRLRRPDEGRLRPRRRVARRVRPGRAADQRGHAVRLPALPRRRARALRAAPEDRRRRLPAHRARLRRTASRTARSRPTTTSRSPPRSPATRASRRSCATGSTAPRPRRCRATRTGRSTRSGPPRRRSRSPRRRRARTSAARASGGARTARAPPTRDVEWSRWPPSTAPRRCRCTSRSRWTSAGGSPPASGGPGSGSRPSCSSCATTRSAA